MPIKGLTDKDQVQFGLNLVKLGSLFKGDEQETRRNDAGKEYKIFGKDLKHFRIAFEPEYEHLYEAWEEMYGDAPKEFHDVFIAQGTVDEAFGTWKEEYSAIGLLHRCDGEHQVRSYQTAGEDKGYWTDAKISCATSCGCTNVGRLNLIFPEFIQETGALGYISVTTHSIHDIITIHKMLTDMFKIRQRSGHDLTGMPFVFGRREKEITTPIVVDGARTGGRRKNTKSLLFIKPTEDFTRAVLLPAMTAPQLSQPTTVLPTLPAPQELKLSGGVVNDSRRITADRPLTVVQTEAPGKKIELDADGKLIVIEPTPEAPEIQPEETPVIIESTATNVITMPETEPDILPTVPTTQAANVTKVSVKRTGQGESKILTLALDNKLYLKLRTRQAFILAGWIGGAMWTADGDYVLDTPIPITIKRDETGKYWELAEVEPAPNAFMQRSDDEQKAAS